MKWINYSVRMLHSEWLLINLKGGGGVPWGPDTLLFKGAIFKKHILFSEEVL